MTRATQDQEQLSRFTGSRNPQPKDVLGAEMEPAWAGLVALECYTTLPLQHRIQLYSGVPVRVTKGPVAERRVDTFRPTPTPASMNGATPSRMPSQCRGRICHPSSSDPPSLTNLQRNNHNPGWPVRQQQFVPPPPITTPRLTPPSRQPVLAAAMPGARNQPGRQPRGLCDRGR